MRVFMLISNITLDIFKWKSEFPVKYQNISQKIVLQMVFIVRNKRTVVVLYMYEYVKV